VYYKTHNSEVCILFSVQKIQPTVPVRGVVVTLGGCNTSQPHNRTTKTSHDSSKISRGWPSIVGNWVWCCCFLMTDGSVGFCSSIPHFWFHLTASFGSKPPTFCWWTLHIGIPADWHLASPLLTPGFSVSDPFTSNVRLTQRISVAWWKTQLKDTFLDSSVVRNLTGKTYQN